MKKQTKNQLKKEKEIDLLNSTFTSLLSEIGASQLSTKSRTFRSLKIAFFAGASSVHHLFNIDFFDLKLELESDNDKKIENSFDEINEHTKKLIDENNSTGI